MPPDLILQDFPKRLSLLFFLPAPCRFHFFRFNSLLTFFGKILNVFTLLWMIRKILMKKNFMEISDSDLKFFRVLWRILIPCGLFSYAYYWLKYNFRSFPQSLDDAEHVRIHSMNIKFFSKKKFSSKFLTQIWSLKRSQYETISPLANFEYQKKKFEKFF